MTTIAVVGTVADMVVDRAMKAVAGDAIDAGITANSPSASLS